MDIHTKKIDYTAAFAHDHIDCLVFGEMPKGFVLPSGVVWKLRKSLYELSQSPCSFFLYTKGKLEKSVSINQMLTHASLSHLMSFV